MESFPAEVVPLLTEPLKDGKAVHSGVVGRKMRVLNLEGKVYGLLISGPGLVLLSGLEKMAEVEVEGCVLSETEVAAPLSSAPEGLLDSKRIDFEAAIARDWVAMDAFRVDGVENMVCCSVVDGFGEGLLVLLRVESGSIISVLSFDALEAGMVEEGMCSVALRPLSSLCTDVDDYLNTVWTATATSWNRQCFLRRGKRVMGIAHTTQSCFDVTWLDIFPGRCLVAIAERQKLGVYHLLEEGGEEVECWASVGLLTDPVPLGRATGIHCVEACRQRDERIPAWYLVAAGTGMASHTMVVHSNRKHDGIRLQNLPQIGTGVKHDISSLTLLSRERGILAFFAGSAAEALAGALNNKGGIDPRRSYQDFVGVPQKRLLRPPSSSSSSSSSLASTTTTTTAAAIIPPPPAKRRKTEAEDKTEGGGGGGGEGGGVPGGAYGRLGMRRSLGFSAGADIVAIQAFDYKEETVLVVLRADSRIVFAKQADKMLPPWMRIGIEPQQSEHAEEDGMEDFEDDEEDGLILD